MSAKVRQFQLTTKNTSELDRVQRIFFTKNKHFLFTNQMEKAIQELAMFDLHKQKV